MWQINQAQCQPDIIISGPPAPYYPSASNKKGALRRPFIQLDESELIATGTLAFVFGQGTLANTQVVRRYFNQLVVTDELQ